MKNYYKGRKILITGGLGFIGSNLAIRLVDLGAKVTIFDALISGYGGNLFNIEPVKDKVEVIIGDMREEKAVKKVIDSKEIIFNLAGTLSHIDSMIDPLVDLEINCRAQLVLLEAARKNNPKVKIVFAGTRNQFGRARYLPVDENHPMEPTDINGINNIAAEKYHLLYTSVYGLPTVSLRMTNTFGPRHQMKHPRQGVLNWFIRQIMDGKTVVLFGDGKQIRDVNYIDDVVEALLTVGQSKKGWGEAFNLGGTPISLRDFVEKAIKVFSTCNQFPTPEGSDARHPLVAPDKRSRQEGTRLVSPNFGSGNDRLRNGLKVKFVAYPPDREKIEVGDYIASCQKIYKTYGWKPKVGLEEGIRKTIEYYRKYSEYYW